MKLLIGLGNPGKAYEKTRHNAGFMLLEYFLKEYEPVRQTVWTNEPRFKSDSAIIVWQKKNGKTEKILLLKPKTYMNNSGLAVSLAVNFYKIPSQDMWVFHDDIDFPFGKFRIRFGGGSGGHKGIMSLIDTLGTDKFWRFKLGIGRSGESEHSGVDHYVLDTFARQESGKLKELLKRGVEAIELGLEEHLEAAMNRYNSR
ncbi:MAG TPA: aminoacyl-tRNA hydrolase [Patescibacteria group bacterium]|nr:aminoacyl-tRNA hydrolase [Patescibacteria group bacterium]